MTHVATDAASPRALSRSARLTQSLSGTNLERASDYNQRVVLQAIRLAGEVTRGELVERTGLTAPTIANITRRLVRLGLVRELVRVAIGRGQPAVRLTVAADGAFGIGLNVDREHLGLVCIDLAGNVRARMQQAVDMPMPDDVRRFVDGAVAELRRAGAVPTDRIVGTGIAIPDRFGTHDAPPAVRAAWGAVDFATLAKGPVHVDNDAAAAALGELQFGAGRGMRSFFYLLFCTGLGGGLVIDGSFHRGATGRGAEIGRMPARSGPHEGEAIEGRVSITALSRRLQEAGHPPDISATPGSTAAAEIDAWLDEAAALLAEPLATVSCLFDPEAILVGGRLPEAIGARLVERLNRGMAEATSTMPPCAPIRLGEMAQEAPAVGAAMLPLLDVLLPSDVILMNAAP